MTSKFRVLSVSNLWPGLPCWSQFCLQEVGPMQLVTRKVSLCFAECMSSHTTFAFCLRSEERCDVDQQALAGWLRLGVHPFHLPSRALTPRWVPVHPLSVGYWLSQYRAAFVHTAGALRSFPANSGRYLNAVFLSVQENSLN